MGTVLAYLSSPTHSYMRFPWCSITLLFPSFGALLQVSFAHLWNIKRIILQQKIFLPLIEPMKWFSTALMTSFNLLISLANSSKTKYNITNFVSNVRRPLFLLFSVFSPKKIADKVCGFLRFEKIQCLKETNASGASKH